MTEKTSVQRAIKFNIAGSVILVIAKLIIGWLTNSMGVLVSALDSMMDSGMSIVNLIAYRHASKPPDEDHAYGHGKIESLASLFQSTLIGFTGLVLVIEAVKRMIYGTSVHQVGAGIGVMVLSVVISFGLVVGMKKARGEKSSLVLSTETLHYSSDILSNLGIIGALLLVQWTGWPTWDLLISILVALYIFRTAFGILRNAVDELLDKSLPPVSQKDIETIIKGYSPAMTSMHNFRSRKVGSQIFMDFHVEIQGESDFKRAHEMTEGLIIRIRKDYPDADITVHYDPAGEN